LGRFSSAFKIAACHFPGRILEVVRPKERLVELRRWNPLISQSGGSPTTFPTRRLSSALAIVRA